MVGAHDPQPQPQPQPRIQLQHDPPPILPRPPPHRLSGYLKRIRNAWHARSSSKSAKRSVNDSVATSGSRRSRTPSPPPFYNLRPSRISHKPTVLSYRSVDQQDPGATASTLPPPTADSKYDDQRLDPLHAEYSEPPPIPQPRKPSALQEWADKQRAASSKQDKPDISPEQDTSDATKSRARRAEDLFAKYGVPIEPEGFFFAEPTSSQDTLSKRVRKDIRMRIHHYCHVCGLGIGPNGVCINCNHSKCKKCKPAGESSSERLPPIAIAPSSITPPGPLVRTESIDSWLSPPATSQANPGNLTSTLLAGPRKLWSTRVVRRLCHQCHSPFIWTETECMDCAHQLCELCPRDPPLTPPGSSSAHVATETRRERVMRKPRIRVRYRCEVCHSLFDEGIKVCSCGHDRCGNCDRFPPRRAPQPKPDPAVLNSLRARLDSF